MFIKIPFESEIPFKTNISEITKMSLEHDYNINDGGLLGNFYISGEYKAHEVSVNKEPFNFTLPFSVELRDDINRDTLEFNIEDFSYDIINNNTLKVNIEYSLKGELIEKEELFERVNEDELQSELEFIDNFLENDEKEIDFEEKNDDVKDDIEAIEETKKEDTKEEVREEKEIPKPVLKEEVKPVVKEEKREEVEEINSEDRISMEEEKTIMETIKDSDDTFVTYHIHVVKESETIETICALYNVPNSLISEYNNIDSISIGDKILIPKIDE